MFSMVSYHPGMPDTRSLRPATADEIAEALSFALRYQGRKRVNHADDAMARILLSGLYACTAPAGVGVRADEGAAACGADDGRNAAWTGIGRRRL